LGAKPDFAKASYYFNPITEVPGTEEERRAYPASYPCNRWPDEEEVSELAGFRTRAKSLGNIMHGAVVLLAKHIDRLAEETVKGYPKNLLYEAMKQTEKAKGRLLYYYPLDKNDEATTFDNWIGWHNDSGFLTSLAGDLYINDDTGEPLPPSQVDPLAGLYVTDRSGASIHVTIPEDCMAVQIGECVQILTGGVVAATPHCVRGPRLDWEGCPSAVKVARISCPCFIDSKPTFPLMCPEGCTREEVVEAGIGREKVPLLEERWVKDGMSFGDFLQKTFEKYYDWKG
jgi:isopenicillin N synthase-like dioxygenase